MATLADAQSDAVRIELSLSSWAAGGPASAKLALIESGDAGQRGGGVKGEVRALDAAILSSISIRIGEERLSKKGVTISVEEVLDLIRHIGKFLGPGDAQEPPEEDEFEWSTAEPTLQMLKVLREGSIAHVNLLLKMYGAPDGYTGDAGLEFRFDTTLENLRCFGGQVREELLGLLNGDRALFDELLSNLDIKITRIRGTGRAPYRRSF